MPVRFAKALRERTVAVRWIAALGSILLSSIAQAQGQQAQEQQSFVTVEGDLKSAAWWVLADFHPFTTEVRGIPVNQIRKNWCKATEFRKDLFPRQLLFDGNVDLMEADKMSFAVEGHFDGSAASEVALVGLPGMCGQEGHLRPDPRSIGRREEQDPLCQRHAGRSSVRSAGERRRQHHRRLELHGMRWPLGSEMGPKEAQIWLAARPE